MMNLKPSLRYQMKEYVDAILVMALVIAAIVSAPAIIMVATGSTGEEINFGGYGAVASIFMFVCGIVYPRSSMRMNIQLGISRRTTFVSMILSAIFASALISVLGELLMTAAQFLTGYLTFAEFNFTDLFALFYLGENVGVLDMTLVQHGTSILFTTCMLFLYWSAGQLFTFLYWRLNKLGTVIVSILLVVLFVGLPIVIGFNAEFFTPMLQLLTVLASRCIDSPWFSMVVFLAGAVVMLLIDWLLVRRANLRGSSGK